MKQSLTTLLGSVQECQLCKTCLPFSPRPILQLHHNAKLLIIGQAPGLKAHQTGIPWNDASGHRLREWIGVSDEDFYDESKIAILPMGFCYPGKGEHGDLPPLKACSELWHEKILTLLPNIKLTLLCGQYAQAAYLKKARQKTLTQTVFAWRNYLPYFIPLPHPSPLNNIWLHKNPWFEEDVLSEIKKIIKSKLG